jgi:hypothetical protein
MTGAATLQEFVAGAKVEIQLIPDVTAVGTYNAGGGWQINGSPTFSYNHEADSNNKWTFPLAVGVSRTMILKGRHWKFGVQYWHYVKSPDLFGLNYQPRFTVSPVVKLPWSFDPDKKLMVTTARCTCS